MARQNKIGVYVPSYGRAGSVTTLKYVKGGVVVVPESQKKDYLKHHPARAVLAIPDDEDGSITTKRNAVLERTPENKIVMIDDDLKGVWWINKKRLLTQDELMGIIEQGFLVCDELGAHYWGFNNVGDRLKSKECTPFSFTKIFFCFLGIIKTELRFDTRIDRVDDVDFWLQNIRRDKLTFRFNFIHAKFDIKKSGQVGGIQTKKDPRSDVELLRRKWGRDVVGITEEGEAWPIKIPYRGI